jgi:hypothetical protein
VVVFRAILIKFAHNCGSDHAGNGVYCEKYSGDGKGGAVSKKAVEKLRVEEDIEIDERVVNLEIQSVVPAVFSEL